MDINRRFFITPNLFVRMLVVFGQGHFVSIFCGYVHVYECMSMRVPE